MLTVSVEITMEPSNQDPLNDAAFSTPDTSLIVILPVPMFIAVCVTVSIEVNDMPCVVLLV